MKTIRYTPTIELIAFLAATGLTTTLYVTKGFQLWVLIAIVVCSYFIILGRTNFITLEHERLKISYCSLLFWTDTINVKDVVSVTSIAVMEEASLDSKDFFFEFRREYQIEFVDKNGATKKLLFRIGNRKAEAELLAGIQNLRNKKVQQSVKPVNLKT